jgi:hypothetical protein
VNGFKIRSKQKGFGVGFFLILILCFLISGDYLFRSEQMAFESQSNTYALSTEEVRKINNALLNYYKDNRSWPPQLSNLVEANYFKGLPSRCDQANGHFQSRFCTTIFGEASADAQHYRLRLNALTEKAAASIANRLPNGTYSDATLTTTINVPNRSLIFQAYLQRKADISDPNRTRLETDIDVHQNRLKNIRHLSAQSGTIRKADINHAQINQAQMRALKADQLSSSSLIANEVNGKNFRAQNDFSTPQSSVNQNYLAIRSLQQELNECMYVTKSCIPDPPRVHFVCINCQEKSEITRFSGRAQASIECPKGCTYRWFTQGRGIHFSGCAAGRVGRNGNAQPICKINAQVASQKIKTGTVTIQITSLGRSKKSQSFKKNIIYRNIAIKLDLKKETALDCRRCFVIFEKDYQCSWCNSRLQNVVIQASAAITSSNKVKGIVIHSTISELQCSGVVQSKEITKFRKGIGFRMEASFKLGEAPILSTRNASCSAYFTITVRSKNIPGKVVYKGVLMAHLNHTSV